MALTAVGVGEEFFHQHTEFDAELNLLRSIAPAPTVFAPVKPAPYDPSKPPLFQALLRKPGSISGFKGHPPTSPGKDDQASWLGVEFNAALNVRS
ncbi:hypothetical protein ABIB99_006586 [Bradyrhizobium sp. LA6.1]|uniref:hypothetical protein n=1 Tax=Bradyrhizobium sp. LA6.1 TaxID=3156378 RepID=UPI0033959A06